MGDHMMKYVVKGKDESPDYLPEKARRIPSCRRLSRDDEHELAGLVAKGDLDARNQFVLANMPLVIKIARDFQGRGLGLDDLIGEGNLGLIRATKEFQPLFGTRFSTYAGYWIRQAIRHALINTTSTIRLPAHMIGMLSKWRRAEQAIANKRGESPRFDDVATVLGLSEAQKLLIGSARQAQCFGPKSIHELDSGSCAHTKSRNRAGECEGTLEADEAHHMLLHRMDRLENRECTILKLRYGLEGQGPLAHKEIGRRLGVTREWVRKLEIRALRKLRDDGNEQSIESSVRPGLPTKPRSGSPRPRWPFRSGFQPGV
jgi:RNA polymerase primary sigma factor